MTSINQVHTNHLSTYHAASWNAAQNVKPCCIIRRFCHGRSCVLLITHTPTTTVCICSDNWRGYWLANNNNYFQHFNVLVTNTMLTATAIFPLELWRIYTDYENTCSMNELAMHTREFCPVLLKSGQSVSY